MPNVWVYQIYLFFHEFVISTATLWVCHLCLIDYGLLCLACQGIPHKLEKVYPLVILLASLFVKRALNHAVLGISPLRCHKEHWYFSHVSDKTPRCAFCTLRPSSRLVFGLFQSVNSLNFVNENNDVFGLTSFFKKKQTVMSMKEKTNCNNNNSVSQCALTRYFFLSKQPRLEHSSLFKAMLANPFNQSLIWNYVSVHLSHWMI